MLIMDKISTLLKENNKTQKDLMDYLGLEKSTFTAWKSGKNMSYKKYLSEIAAFFNVSLDWLTGIEYDEIDKGVQKLYPGWVKGKNYLPSPNYYPEVEDVKMIEKYHALDDHGKKIVTLVLDEEYNRVTTENAVSTTEQPNIIQLSFSGAKVSAGIGDELMDYEQWEKVSVQETADSRKADFILIVDGDSMEPQYSNDDYVMVRSQPAVDIGQIGIFDVDGKGYMKKFGGDRLISLNSKYPDIIISEDDKYKCFGLVIGKTTIICD